MFITYGCVGMVKNTYVNRHYIGFAYVLMDKIHSPLESGSGRRHSHMDMTVKGGRVL